MRGYSVVFAEPFREVIEPTPFRTKRRGPCLEGHGKRFTAVLATSRLAWFLFVRGTLAVHDDAAYSRAVYVATRLTERSIGISPLIRRSSPARVGKVG